MYPSAPLARDLERLEKRYPIRNPPDLRGLWSPSTAAVINCVGIIAESSTQRFTRLHAEAPIALFRACELSSIRRVIQISALGADEMACSPYHLSKRAADEVLRGLTLDWFILRPSLVVGSGGRSTAWLRRLANLPVLVLPGSGEQAVQPILVGDVAATVLKCLESGVPPRKTLDLVGPEAMTFRHFLGLLRRQSFPKPLLTWPIPLSWLCRFLVLSRHSSPCSAPITCACCSEEIRQMSRPLQRSWEECPCRFIEEIEHELSAA